ncbi:MAG: ATP-binding protein [Pseudomonadota bacterium]
MRERYLDDLIIQDALQSHKIAFISGPRQVGKTTMAKSILKKFDQSENYYSWDDDEFRLAWIRSIKQLIQGKKLAVFDEIHKDRAWKSKLKGLYDTLGEETKFIVSGSARMDYYRKSGDSLQGRYFPYRLHPFSLGEIPSLKKPPELSWEEGHRRPDFKLDDLLELSGFPEPLLGGNKGKAARWRKLYRERLMREDIRDLYQIRELSSLENLSLLLTSKVGSQLSYESLRQDLSCSFDTILRWIDILESVYYCYRLRPYSKKIKNAIKKEPKLFLFDWSSAETKGAKLENLIAGHLLKNVHAWTDAALGDFELYYLRDKQKREVDFFITKDGAPYLLLEVKSNQSTPTNSLCYFQNILKPTFCFQLIQDQRRESRQSLLYPGIQVISVERFLSAIN